MCIVLGILILALLAYIVYLYASYYRIEDNQELVVEAPVDDTTTGAAAVLATDTEYSAVTYNIGFGAYLPDYSFFMDGGTSSWAESPETVQYAINGAGELVKSLDPDFALIQEIDLDATRSYHTDEYEMLRNLLPEYTTVFAQNYDSAFLFYPFTQPHGTAGQDSDCSRNIRCLPPCAEASPYPLPSASSSIWTVLQRLPDPGGQRQGAGDLQSAYVRLRQQR